GWLGEIRRISRGMLGGKQGERFRRVERGVSGSALGGSPPSQRVREPEPNCLGTVWRDASQPVDQSPGGGAVASPERVLNQVEVSGRKGRVERDRPLQRPHDAVERQERKVPEMKVRVSQEVPGLRV